MIISSKQAGLDRASAVYHPRDRSPLRPENIEGFRPVSLSNLRGAVERSPGMYVTTGTEMSGTTDLPSGRRVFRIVSLSDNAQITSNLVTCSRLDRNDVRGYGGIFFGRPSAAPGDPGGPFVGTTPVQQRLHADLGEQIPFSYYDRILDVIPTATKSSLDDIALDMMNSYRDYHLTYQHTMNDAWKSLNAPMCIDMASLDYSAAMALLQPGASEELAKCASLVGLIDMAYRLSYHGIMHRASPPAAVHAQNVHLYGDDYLVLNAPTMDANKQLISDSDWGPSGVANLTFHELVGLRLFHFQKAFEMPHLYRVPYISAGSPTFGGALGLLTGAVRAHRHGISDPYAALGDDVRYTIPPMYAHVPHWRNRSNTVTMSDLINSVNLSHSGLSRALVHGVAPFVVPDSSSLVDDARLFLNTPIGGDSIAIYEKEI